MNRTVERAMQILQIVSERSEGITLQELADEMNIPKSSAFVIVQTLLAGKYLEPMKHNAKRYCLGIEVFTLGMRYVNDLNWVGQCARYLDPLAEKFNKTAFVGVLDEDSVVYVHKYVGKKAMLASCALGSRHEVHATALGKALLAFSDEETRETILSRITLESLTEHTITDRARLVAELEETRKRGYSLDIKEQDLLMACCGAPIMDYSGKVIAAVSLSDIYDSRTNEDAIGEELKEVAGTISESLGYNPAKRVRR
jgi:DNA-binding IclR family transcriptional regulator